MLVQPFLRRLVVIRADGEDAVRAQRFEFARALDHFGGVVAAGTGHDGHLAARLFDRDFDHAALLGMRERGAFARGAAGDEEIDSRVDLAPRQAAHGFFVERQDPCETE